MHPPTAACALVAGSGAKNTPNPRRVSSRFSSSTVTPGSTHTVAAGGSLISFSALGGGGGRCVPLAMASTAPTARP